MRDLCFIDVESTGLDSDIHEIIEIALIRTTFELEPKMRYHAFILPEHIETADPRALEINHYNEEHWEKEAISFLEASEHILPLTEECILAGHNVPFDSTFLTAAIKKLGLKPNWNYHRFDTSSLALLFLAQKKIRNVSLGNLLRTFGIQ